MVDDVIILDPEVTKPFRHFKGSAVKYLSKCCFYSVIFLNPEVAFSRLRYQKGALSVAFQHYTSTS